MRLTTFLICIFLTNLSMAQTSFSAILQKTDSELIHLYEIPFEEVEKQNAALSPEGYELIDLERQNNKFWAIWRHSGESTSMEQAESWEAFQEIKKQKIKDGHLLSKVLIHTDADGRRHYLGIWKAKRKPHNVWKLPDLKSVRFHYSEMAKLSLYLQDIQVVEEADGSQSYYLLYHKGSSDDMTHFTHFSSESAFNEDRVKRLKSGYRPVDLEIIIANGIPNYYCLYRKQKEEAELQYQLDWESFLHYEDFLGADYRVVDIEFSEGKQRVFAPPFSLKRTQKTPDTDMASLQLSTKGIETSIQNHSAAFAAANGLVWLSENGYGKLAEGRSVNPEHAAGKIARKLADANHMQTLMPSKANSYTVIQGLFKYITDAGYKVDQLGFYDLHDFDEQKLEASLREVFYLENSLSQLPLQKAKEGLTGSSVVLLRWGMYQADTTGEKLVKKSDQWGTLVGYGKNEHGVEKPNYIVVHDPADGDEPQQKYFRVDDLEQYFLTTKETKLLSPSTEWQDEAEKFDALPALKKQLLSEFEEGADDAKVFPVWESLLIVKIK